MKDKLFIIPVPELKGNDAPYHILYSPFTHQCCIISAEDATRLQHTIETEPTKLTAANFPEFASLLQIDPHMVERTCVQNPHQYTKLSILPTYSCNFKCSYCYSAEGRDKTKISKQHLDIALNDFLKKSDNKQTRTLFISGGGEPLTAWEQVQYAIRQAESLAKENDLRIEIIIITNASLLNDEIITFFKHHHVHVCVSFEIAENAQKLSRGHWEAVNNNILKCIHSGLIPSINATITPANVAMMPDMLRHLQQNLPQIKHVTMEPLTPNTGFDSVDAMHNFYEQFMQNFTKIRQQAALSGIDINSTILDNMKRVATRHCQGKLCLTPSATYTICHCASSPKEARYEKCRYGSITDDGRPDFDYAKFNALQSINVYNRDKCRDCYAKWNCAGGCMTKFDAFPAEQQDEYCRYYREHIKRLLLEEIDNGCVSHCGKTLQEILNS